MIGLRAGLRLAASSRTFHRRRAALAVFEFHFDGLECEWQRVALEAGDALD